MRMWQELESLLSDEMSVWLEKFPSRPFIERIIKRVYSYYDPLPNKPTDKESWKRAVSSFLAKDWEEEKKRHARADHLTKKVEAHNTDQEIEKQIKDLAKTNPCPMCHSSGYVTMFTKKNYNCVTFLCTCAVGKLASTLRTNQARRVRFSNGEETDIARTRFFDEAEADRETAWVRDF